MNSIAVKRLWAYTGAAPRPVLLTVIILLLVFSFPLSMIAARQFPVFPVRWFYILSTSAMGAVTISLALILIAEILRAVFPVMKPYIGYSALAATAVLVIVALANGQKIVITHIELPIRGLSSEVKIIHLSDIHLGIVNDRRFAAKLVDAVNEIDGDIVVITGDLFDGSRHPEKRCVEDFDRLRYPVYMCSGNHDLYEGLEKVEHVLKGSAIRYLKNSSIVTHGLEIIGVDQPSNDMHRGPHIPEGLPSRPELPGVLLYHMPASLEHADARGIDLQLSGHTHWGQIWPFNHLVKLAFPKGFGLTTQGNMKLYTSPGTGTWGPPMRLGSRNTIAVIHLIPENL